MRNGMVDIDRNKFHEMIQEVAWPTREVEKYAPPEVREQSQPDPITAVQELAVLCRTLTYGEMMEFAEGIGADPAKVNAWARNP